MPVSSRRRAVALERAVLVRHGGTTDPETGGAFTVKRYRAAGGRVVLEPVNREFAPLVVNAADRYYSHKRAGTTMGL